MKTLNFMFLAILLGLFTLSSCEKEVGFQESDISVQASGLRCPTATFTVSPCDHTFRVFALFNGSPTGFTYSYTITLASNNSFVGSGTIQNGQYTAPVLNYCTLYNITLYDPCDWNNPTTIQLYSDGCNNTFLC